MSLKSLASAAAVAVLALGSYAFADNGQLNGGASADPSQIALGSPVANPVMLDDTTAPSTAPAVAAPASAPSLTTSTPFMYLIGNTGVGTWLSNNKFNITGFVEGGYFYDTNNPNLGTGPKGDAPTYVTFPGAYSNRFLLDQLDLTLEKTIDTTKKWDWGFLFENGYGTDDSYTHSHGMLDNRPPNDPQNQYDILQANVSLLVPLGTGLTITAGKFVALLGDEVISPLGNAFFTHSYNFFYGIPATNTGIMGLYTLSKLINGNDWTINGGITEGWNQSLRNNNGDIDFLAEMKGNITSNVALTINIEEGPEAANNSSDYWTAIEAIPSWTVSDQLTITGDFLYVDAPGDSATTTGSAAQWYGAVGYVSYKINGMFTPNLRIEWYRDQGAATTGNQANYGELTVGVQIHPLPNDPIFQWLQIRPEIRGDCADRPVFDTSYKPEYSELTAAFDVIMQF